MGHHGSRFFPSRRERGTGRQKAGSVWVAVTLLVVVVCTSFASAQAPGPGEEGAVPIELELEPGLHLDKGTYLVGRIAFQGDLLRNPGVVGVTDVTTPGGDLVVCPIERGASGLIPTLTALDMDCSGGQRHEEPELGFGDRTWLQLAGAYRGGSSERASVNLIAPEGPYDGPLWLTTPAGGEVQVAYGVDGLRFSPTTSASRVVVFEDGEPNHYNGTDWAFLFERAGTSTVTGAGFVATIDADARFTLSRGALADVEQAKRPRVFIDLQEMVMGADAREAVGNATRHFTTGVVPHFQNAALLGNINGTVGQLEPRGENGTLVHGDGFRFRLDGTTLDGTGDVQFVLHGDSLWLRAENPQSAPWFAVALLWAVALAALLVGFGWRPPAHWQAWVERLLPFLALIVWDRITSAVLDVSALDVLFDGGSLGWILRLGVVEVVSFLMGWFLLYVPGRTIVRRVLPSRFSIIAPAVAYPLFLVYAWWVPGALLEMAGILVRV